MFYNFVRAIAKGLFFFLGIKHEGLHNVPEDGAQIIAANHLSYYDPIVIAVLVKRPIYFMAKEEFFQNKLFGKFLTAINAFPVKRGSADRKAIKSALAILKKGEIIGIFPEGTRKSQGTEVAAQTGTALIAIKSDTPVIPVACIGTQRMIPFRSVKVVFGEPIKYYNENDMKINSKTLEAFSQKIADEINLLLANSRN
ncbi:MAG TPA: lysophospholipid acyltransferase family protein [Syntrophomonadaceae bacterium]|nr:lysophospholipid acyltransferase family protein [Syntrophomonadaceae bacterium]HNX28621.1 lysophospholipid acyltransferase family protein [Syntrophomonadaceae bacterium]HPR94019.1 lysophospholipid acyltransferase family protein [Syntrophomonadaceae bacterium]